MRRSISLRIEEIDAARIQEIADATSQNITEVIEGMISLGVSFYDGMTEADGGARQREIEGERYVKDLQRRIEYYRQEHEWVDGRSRRRKAKPKQELEEQQKLK